jgi:glycosyltransferase involved in cell wall biosynthesis
MKALIVDPGLRSAGGHHTAAALRLKAELARLGVDTTCLASAYAEPDVVQALGCVPCFSRSVYGRNYQSPIEFASGVEQTERELAVATAASGLAADLLVLPCCDQMLAQAVAKQLRRRRLGQPPHVLAWVLYPPRFRRPAEPQAGADVEAECREAFGLLLRAVGRTRLRVFCETAALADHYRRLLSLEVDVMSGPGLALHRADSPADYSSPHPTVVCLGYANRAKGYGLLPQAVASVLERHRDVRFLIHGVTQGTDAADEARVFEQLAELGPHVSVRQDVLGRDEYESWLAAADFLLLPYDPDVYRARGSGIFSEAARLGIPVIAPDACAFAQPAFDSGWAVPIARYDAGGVAEAILAALADRQALTDRARTAAAQYEDRLPRLLREAIAAATVAPRVGRRRGLLQPLREQIDRALRGR